MKRTSFSQFHCSLAQTLEKMGDWWTPLILRDLFLGVNRFDDLVEDLGLSRNLLASRLKDLIANGIITHEKPSVGRAHYLLTPAGFELVPILVALTAWETSGQRLTTAPRLFSATKPAASLLRPLLPVQTVMSRFLMRILMFQPALEANLHRERN